MTLVFEADRPLVVEVALDTERVSISQAQGNRPGLLRVLGPGKVKRVIGISESAEVTCAWTPTLTAKLVKALRESAPMNRLEFEIGEGESRRRIDVRETNLLSALQAEHSVDAEVAQAAITAAGFKINPIQETLGRCYVPAGQETAGDGPRMAGLRNWGRSGPSGRGELWLRQGLSAQGIGDDPSGL